MITIIILLESSLIIPFIATTLLFLLLGVFVISILLIYKKRKSEHLKEKQLMQSAFQQELLKSQLEIQEANFKNISQEIHDNIGQALSFIKLNINTIDITEQEAAR